MKLCKDGRIWGQNNKEAGEHLGILTRRKYIKKGTASESKKGSKNPRYGKHLSLETLAKISKAKSNERNPNWRGGISSMNNRIRRRTEFRLWREAVFARDNWTCQECGQRGGVLHPHHIKSFKQYPELRFAIDNGKTLCIKCHKLTDNYSGKSNNGKSNKRKV